MSPASFVANFLYSTFSAQNLPHFKTQLPQASYVTSFLSLPLVLQAHHVRLSLSKSWYNLVSLSPFFELSEYDKWLHTSQTRISFVEVACQNLVRLRFGIRSYGPVYLIVSLLRLDLNCRCQFVFLWCNWLVYLFEFRLLIVAWLKFDLTDTHTLLVSQRLIHQYYCTLVW